MPEGPEVLRTVEYLSRVLEGNILSEWIFCGGKHTEIPPDGYNGFDSNLPMVVESVSCKGKFIYFTLAPVSNREVKFYILHSLMMTGCWQTRYDEQCKWFVELENGKTIWFRDPRALATLAFTTDYSDVQKKLTELGPDILQTTFTIPEFKTLCFQYRKRNVTSFLMDQTVFSGIGNAYKSEILFDSSISPLRKVGDLDDREQEKLLESLRVIPRIGYSSGGLSIRDFHDENGNSGALWTSSKSLWKETDGTHQDS